MSLNNAIKSLQVAKAVQSVRFDAQKPGFGDVNTFNLTLDSKTIGTMDFKDLKELTAELNDAIRPVLDQYASRFVESAMASIDNDSLAVTG